MEKKRLYAGAVLVTGASRGIGRETALILARRGYTVYCASRSGQAPEDSGNLVGVKMDVTDPESVRAAASQIGDVQVVIHCAGFGIAGSCEGVQTADAKRQLETNFFGVLTVNNVFLPILRRHERSLVVITSSVAGLIPIPYQAHYSCSKFALEAYAEALRMEARRYGVRVTLVEPGDTKTSFTQNRVIAESPDSDYYRTCIKSVAKMAHDEQNGAGASKPAMCIAGMLERNNPPVRCAVGFGYKALCMLKRLLPARLIEAILRLLYIPSV